MQSIASNLTAEVRESGSEGGQKGWGSRVEREGRREGGMEGGREGGREEEDTDTLCLPLPIDQWSVQ